MARLIASAEELLESVPGRDLTIRMIANHAGVASATAYNYFSSLEHLMAEAYWRRMQALPLDDSPVGSPAERLADTLISLATLVANHPHMAELCTTALLSTDPEVRRIRELVGGECYRRVSAALGPAASAELIDAALLVLQGTLIRAGTDHLGYDDVPRSLRSVVHILTKGIST